MTENGTRARFLAAIASRVDAATVEEVHLFQPIKQGGIESGVAVVAVDENRRGRADAVDARNRAEGAAEDETGSRSEPAENSARLAVYTATYRLTLKGPERGKWEFAMHAEADAPLVTVDAVVRGVQRRSGDVDEAEKLDGAEFRELLETIPADAPPAPSPKP